MRKIEYIVLHCTATPQKTTVSSILRYWRENLGWKNPGYHHMITPDGVIHDLLPIEKVSNGVKGFNSNSIHISYIGGEYKDDRTALQKLSQIKLINKYRAMFPDAEIKGHRDFPNVAKDCPNFDVKTWLRYMFML